VARPASGLRRWAVLDTPNSASQARVQGILRSWRKFIANPLAIIGLLAVGFLIFVALAARWIAPESPYAPDLARAFVPPGAADPFGTDQLGRDIFSRMVHGSGITLCIVLTTAAIVAPVGLLVGCTAGYFGGIADIVLMRVTDVFLAFPSLIMALAIVATIGPGIENAILAISLTAWPPLARVARAEALVLRRADYISWALMLGVSPGRIVLRHILPMCAPSVVVRLSLDMAGIVLTAAGLGFLGLGAQPPSPEWGAMLAVGRQYMLQYWWMTTIPGLAIFMTSMAFNFIADGLRDVLDPRFSR
jgi:peptide/nickel transport system permease protein